MGLIPFTPARSFYLWLLVMCTTAALSAQNIVPNPDFEFSSSCPPAFGFGWLVLAVPWETPTLASPDYFNACADPNTVGVPVNYFGYQEAHSGIAYAGTILKYAFPPNYREYISAPLLEPMVAGYTYDLNLWINLADTTCGIKNIGVYVSPTQPWTPTNELINVIPQFENNLGFLDDSVNWVLLSGCIVSTGGEQWITIGNFHTDADSPIDPTCTHSVSAYYYIDDVSLVQSDLAEVIDIDLGGPVVGCGSYVIDPGIPNAWYTWEDGSHGSTLNVTESGNYALTVTVNCTIGYDSIDVTIIPIDAVEIGPAEVNICEGETYSISLDPSLGDYVWQDGSTDPHYEITTTGLYQVTLDNGCLVSSDQVQVNVISPPAPFSLGVDTFVCPGETIDFNFDPDLGEFIWQDNSDSPSYTVSESGVYALTISNACGEYEDDVYIEAIAIPDYTLGPDDLNLCIGESYEIQLDPGLGVFLWQDGSIDNEYSISTPGNYSVTVSNVCASVSKDINVFYFDDPHVDLGPDIPLCSGQFPYVLSSNAVSAISYLWQDGSTDSTLLVHNPGTYSVTVTNACSSVSDDIQVILDDQPPAITLPSDQTLCAGQTLLLDVSSIMGNYTWQDSTTNSTLLVNQAGTYAVTVANQCGVDSDTITVAYLDSLNVPDLGPDVSLCPGEQLVLSPNISGVTYLWSDNSTADSLLVTSAGTYFVQVADQCFSASDTIQVALNNNPPQLALPSQLNLCQGDSITLDAIISGVSYLWNDNSQASTLTVSSPGTYSLTVSNVCGIDVDTVSVLNAGPAPFVSLGNDVQLCPGDVFALSPVYADVTSWLWSDGSTSDSYSVSGDELVTVEVTNACGVSVDTLFATLLPATPPIDLGADTSLCPGNTLLLAINSPNVNVEWSDGSVNNQFVVNGPGNYYATISNSCGENTDTIHVDALPPSPVLNLGIDQSLCPGEVITLNPGINNVNYLWQDGSTDNSFNATQAGLIILTVSNSCGVATDSLNIVFSNNGPDVNLGPNVLACEGDVVTLMSDISGVNYLWQDGSTASSFSTSSSGLYYLQVSNNCGVDIDSVNVDINGTPPDTELGSDTTLCKGNTLVLSSTADPGTTLQWQDGSSLPTYMVTAPGSYSLFESNHCGVHADTVEVNYLDPPIAFELGPDTTICPGESILLQAPSTSSILKWQDGSTGSTFLADKEQTYSLELSNNCGSTSDALIVSFDHRVPVITLDSINIWCPGTVLSLDATQLFPVTYLWNNGSTSPIITIETQGHYSVYVQAPCADGFGETNVVPGDTCFSFPSFFIPNVFSPNDDNINDVFSVMTNPDIEIRSIHGVIFDRWGNLVFKSDAKTFTWDGRFNGEALNPGVFAYLITIAYIDTNIERTESLYGDVTLIR
jgi:gliding motility-associated-like protein